MRRKWKKEREDKEADTTHLDLSTGGKGLGEGKKTSFNREHEYLSSLGAVGFFCLFLLLEQRIGGEEGEVGGPEEPSWEMWDLSCSKRVKRRRRDKRRKRKRRRKRKKGEEVLKARRAGTEASRLGQVRVGGGEGGQQEEVQDERWGEEAAVGSRKYR